MSLIFLHVIIAVTALVENYPVGSPLFLWFGYYQSIKTKGQNQRQRSLDDLEIDGGSPPDNDFSE